jgi:hypothetical protein
LRHLSTESAVHGGCGSGFSKNFDAAARDLTRQVSSCLAVIAADV